MAIQDLAKLIGGNKRNPLAEQPPANKPLLNIPSMLPQQDDATAYAESRGPIPVPTDVTVQGKEALVPRSLMQQQPEAAESAMPESGVMPMPEKSKLQALMEERDAMAADPAKKQNPWMQALFLGLQGIEKIFTPNDKPIELLGNAKKRYKMEQMNARLAPLMQTEAYRQDQEKRALQAEGDKVQIENVKGLMKDRETDNARQEAALKQKKEKDDRDYDLRTKTLDWKKEDRDRYYELEDAKRQAKDRNDQRTYELAVRRQEEIERKNQATEGINERKVAVQERKAADLISRMSSGGGGSAGKGKASKPFTAKEMDDWTKVAQKLDEDFNSGRLSEEAYNNLIAAMDARIRQRK